jgi:hypothetical protein
MDNKCSITMKESKGDTIKEQIMRYARNDSNLMLNTYIKYEDKMVIEKIFEPLYNGFKWERFTHNVRAFFRLTSARFIKQFFKIGYSILFKLYHAQIIFGFFTILYLLHWVLFQGSSSHIIYSFTVHFGMLILITSLIFFEKNDIGRVEKMQLSRDLEVNVVGQLLYLMNEHQLERIDELNDRFCFDCLVIRSKHADHCKKCGVCVNFRHKHSKLMGRCIGAENA